MIYLAPLFSSDKYCVFINHILRLDFVNHGWRDVTCDSALWVLFSQDAKIETMIIVAYQLASLLFPSNITC